MRPQRYLLAALLAAILVPGAEAFAQAKAKGGGDYPNRPVRMIVPLAPGGASDTVGRIIQPVDRAQPAVAVKQ